MSLDEAIDLLSKVHYYDETHKMYKYVPYGFQKDFHNAVGKGTKFPAMQRALMAANQIGKTYCGAMEMAYHLTGEYPKWWNGPVFHFPVNALVSGVTNESVRDILQATLFGDPTNEQKLGTGTVPRETIGKVTRKAGVPNAYDSVQVRHRSGGWSKVNFRAYEQGWEKFMGFKVDIGWCDEEPPEEVWSQMIRATLATKGYLYITFTPEKGVTKVVYQFMNDLQPGQALIRATWDDAAHMNDERRNFYIGQIPAHQREMRSKGIPLMGSGLVYPVNHDALFIDPIELPKHWPRICGIDFGIDHAFAGCWLAWDRDTDTIYQYDEYKERDKTMPDHVSKLNNNGKWIPVVWPHDGVNREKSSGQPLADLYRKEGANMLPNKFSNPPGPGTEEGKGGNSVEFGVSFILNKMEGGSFKIFKTCVKTRAELGMYHRQNGLIVAVDDDLMSAQRYAALSLRHARTPSVKMPKQQVVAGAVNW